MVGRGVWGDIFSIIYIYIKILKTNIIFTQSRKENLPGCIETSHGYIKSILLVGLFSFIFQTSETVSYVVEPTLTADRHSLCSQGCP